MAWNATVGCVAILCIMGMAFAIMLHVIELSEGIRRIGVTLGCALLLTIFPASILDIWSQIPLWQKLGACSLLGVAVVFLGGLKRRSRKARRGHPS